MDVIILCVVSYIEVVVRFQESLVDDTEVGVQEHLSLVVRVGAKLLLEQLLAGTALLCSYSQHFGGIDLLKVLAPDGVRFRLIDYVFTQRISSL